MRNLGTHLLATHPLLGGPAYALVGLYPLRSDSWMWVFLARSVARQWPPAPDLAAFDDPLKLAKQLERMRQHHVVPLAIS